MERYGIQWEKSNRSRLRLMHAAHDLFVEHGYQNVTVNDICKRAGLTKGAFYHHFPGKESLYRQLLVPSLDEYIQERFTMDEAEGTRDKLQNLARCVFEVSKSMGRELMAQDFIRMLSCQSSDIYRTERVYTRILSQIIRDGMERGEVRTNLDLHNNIMLYACLMSGFLVRWSSANESDNLCIDWDSLLEQEIGLLALK